MGCCQSTSHDGDVPPPTDIGTSAQIAAPQQASRRPRDLPSHPGTPQDASTTTAARSTRRPNKPIRAPSPLRTSPANVSHLPPPWSRAQLERERAAFFDTRVAGRAEVWTALKLVCDMLQAGNVADAQGILDALNLTCPSGSVSIERGREGARGGVYDERGELYELPGWVVTDPEDLVEDKGEDNGEAAQGSEKQDDDDDSSAGQPDRLRMPAAEHKGKGRAADVGEQIRVRLRLSDRGTDVLVTVGSKELVLEIVRRVREHIGLKRVRLVYLGHVLLESKSLAEQGYQTGNVINAYVFEGSEDMLKKGPAK